MWSRRKLVKSPSMVVVTRDDIDHGCANFGSGRPRGEGLRGGTRNAGVVYAERRMFAISIGSGSHFTQSWGPGINEHVAGLVRMRSRGRK